MSKTCWKDLISEAVTNLNDGPLLACTLTPKQEAAKFDAGYGMAGGEPFTAWTQNYVLFPAVYDGSEWVEAVPRHPCDDVTYHVGGQ